MLVTLRTDVQAYVICSQNSNVTFGSLYEQKKRRQPAYEVVPRQSLNAAPVDAPI